MTVQRCKRYLLTHPCAYILLKYPGTPFVCGPRPKKSGGRLLALALRLCGLIMAGTSSCYMRQLPTLSIESPNSPACPSSYPPDPSFPEPRDSGHARRKNTQHHYVARPSPLLFLRSSSIASAFDRARPTPPNMADSGNAPKPSSSVKLVLLGEAAVGKVRIRRQPCRAVPSD